MFVTDSAGNRIVAKFYSPVDFPTPASELEFEKKLVKKTKDALHRTDAEVLMLDGFTVVYRSASDITFAVVGPGEENDLMLVGVLDALYETMVLLLKGVVDNRSVLAQLELLLLALDELIEGGVPFELDAPAIEARVMLRGAVPDTISSYNEMTIGTVADKLGDKIKKQCVIWYKMEASASASARREARGVMRVSLRVMVQGHTQAPRIKGASVSNPPKHQAWRGAHALRIASRLTPPPP